MKLSGMIGHVPGRNRLDFGDDQDVFVDPEPFSRILYHWVMVAYTTKSKSFIRQMAGLAWR
jgi:hypothetical protein